MRPIHDSVFFNSRSPACLPASSRQKCYHARKEVYCRLSGSHDSQVVVVVFVIICCIIILLLTPRFSFIFSSLLLWCAYEPNSGMSFCCTVHEWRRSRPVVAVVVVPFFLFLSLDCLPARLLVRARAYKMREGEEHKMDNEEHVLDYAKSFQSPSIFCPCSYVKLVKIGASIDLVQITN